MTAFFLPPAALARFGTLFTDLVIYAYIFIVGSLVGSFLNVCIYRLPRGKSVFRPMRSYCPHCHEMIPWHDNVPILSFFFLGGCCRHCGSAFSAQYAVVEALTAGLFVLTYIVLRAREPAEAWPVVGIYMAFAAALVAASFIDLELRIIPDSITLGGAGAAVALSVLFPDLHNRPEQWREWAFFANDATLGSLGACLAGMGTGALSVWATGRLGRLLFRKEAMGLGDVKFMAFVGGILGWRLTLVAFFVAPFFGAVVGVFMLLRTRDHHIPYGPFLSIGSYIAMLWGVPIVNFVTGMG